MRALCALAATLAAFTLAGCANPLQAQYINGDMYAVGAGTCEKWSYRTRGSINCYTSGGSFTEMRYPLNERQTRMLQTQAAQRAAEVNAFVEQSNATSAQFNQNAQQTLQRSYEYQPPAVNSYGQPNNTIRCISAGIYTNCRY